MSNVSNELGISKNQKIQILLEMGYELCSIVNDLYSHPKKVGTAHWVQTTELTSYFYDERNFTDFLKYKLNK